jgi:hypothetical protein
MKNFLVDRDFQYIWMKMTAMIMFCWINLKTQNGHATVTTLEVEQKAT